MGVTTRETGRTGPPAVAILSWEMNPMVAGGSWTACYHFVRKLHKHKVKLVVVAPWRQNFVDPDPFGCQIPTALLGILGHDKGSAQTLTSREGSYRGRPAGGSPPYGGYVPYAPYAYGGGPYQPFRKVYGSGYGGSPPYGGYVPYAPYAYGGGSYQPFLERYGSGYGGSAAGGRNLEWETFFDFMRQASDLYTERLLELARRTSFALIHAQDWVTFQAAGEVSRTFGTPWIAHFHSVERDRRPWAPDAAVERIESNAAHSADFVVTPSQLTARCVAEYYGVGTSKIVVVPNVLSRAPAHLARGLFSSKRVVFLGCLEWQKAPDRFAQVAVRVRERDSDVTFRVFGEGQWHGELTRHGSMLEICGPLSWGHRWSAFDGAAAVVVPSRAEPFGMVVLEAMQCAVPVLYSSEAGVAEVIRSGIPIQADDIESTADRVLDLLADPKLWENTAEAERREIRWYPGRGYEHRLLKLYEEMQL